MFYFSCNIFAGFRPLSTSEKAVISLSGVLVVLVLIVIGLLYRFRHQLWQFKYQLAKYRLKKKELNVNMVNNQFIYDAFVSYSSADESWVLNELVEHLESNYQNESDQIKLCLHERDFQIGLPIADNIVLSLQNSATCILVLTEKFTESYWCNFEAQVAHHMFQEQHREQNLVKQYFELLFNYYNFI
jgi:hypothetical protein